MLFHEFYESFPRGDRLHLTSSDFEINIFLKVVKSDTEKIIVANDQKPSH